MRWRRMLILGAMLVVYTLLIGVIGSLAFGLLFGIEDLEDIADLVHAIFTNSEAITWVWVPAIVVTITQMVFLLPVFSTRFAPTERGRPLMLSVCAAALVAGMLFVGLFSACAELIYLLRTGETDVGDVLHGNWLDDVIDHDRWGVWPYVLVSWIQWMPLVWGFCRRTPPARLHGRLVGWLLGGTIAEVLVVLPLDIIVRRKSSCYCNTGTFLALVMSSFALLWLAGPGIVLALTSKRRRWWREGHCECCGYEKGPSPGERCPECGTAWSALSCAKPQATGS